MKYATLMAVRIIMINDWYICYTKIIGFLFNIKKYNNLNILEYKNCVDLDLLWLTGVLAYDICNLHDNISTFFWILMYTNKYKKKVFVKLIGHEIFE